VFYVVHYAGMVAYNVTSFLEKNKDELAPEIEKIIATSTRPFLVKLHDAQAVAAALSPTNAQVRWLVASGSRQTRA
jgi:myosin heavy subunit